MDTTQTVINWTTCQQNAIQDIVAWSYQVDKLTWTLSGAAGTGKSTTIKEILKHIKQQYGVCVSAPTHKAKTVIEKFTGERGETIQKLLGLRPDFDVENFDPNKLKFGRKNRPIIGNFALVIVDEASMISKELFQFLIEQAEEHHTKILFVGDSLQLPPVGEKSSKVFEDNSVDGISTLRTPARQKPTNPLTMVLLALRNDLEPTNDNFSYLTNAIDTFELGKGNTLMQQLSNNHKSTFQTLRQMFPVSLNSDGEGYIFTPNVKDFETQLLSAFESREFQDDYDFAKFVAYTNNEVSTYNKMVRNHLIKKKNPLTVGEYLMGYTSITDYATKINILTNSMEYEIVEIEETVTEHAIRAYNILLVDTLTGNDKQWIRIVNPDHYDKFLEIQQEFYWDAVQRSKRNDRKGWITYYKFKNNHLLIDDLGKLKANKYYPSKDIDYGYGCTVHKSQGSTFQVLFANGRNIAESYKIGLNRLAYKRSNNKSFHGDELITQEDKDFLRRQALSLMYVALSRASKFTMTLM